MPTIIGGAKSASVATPRNSSVDSTAEGSSAQRDRPNRRCGSRPVGTSAGVHRLDRAFSGAVDVMTMARDERAELVDLLVTLTPEQWDAPTPCTGWRVRDVVAHVFSYD